jgi:hypothetical protein
VSEQPKQPIEGPLADFAGSADVHRRAGRLAEAEQVAREGLAKSPDSPATALVLALVLLDQARPDEARRTLEGWCMARLHDPPVPTTVPTIPPTTVPTTVLTGVPVFGVEMSDSELDNAFADAETDRDQLVDPDTIAERAIEQAERGDFVGSDSSFATETVASLLERQGDGEGASRIRAQLIDPLVAPGTGTARERDDRSGRQSKIRELERWLSNLRGGAQ